MARSNPRDLLTAPQFRGMPFIKIVGSGTYAGWTTINSGVATATVSTSLVKSDSMIQITHVEVGSLGVANVGSCGPIVTQSLAEGVSFMVARSSGTSIGASTKIGWLIYRTT